VETIVIPIVVRALRTVAKGLEKNSKTARTKVTVELLQKAALLKVLLWTRAVVNITV